MHTFYWGCCIWFLLKSIYRVCAQSISPVQLYATPRTVASQAPLSMGFPKQEYWSGLPFPAPRDLPHPGIKLVSSALADRFFTTEPPGGHWVANLNTSTKRAEACWNSLLAWRHWRESPHTCHSASLKSADIIPCLILYQSPHYNYLLEGRFCTRLILCDLFFFMCSTPISLAALQRTFFVSLALEARVLAFQGLTGLQNQKDSSWQPTTSRTLHR